MSGQVVDPGSAASPQGKQIQSTDFRTAATARLDVIENRLRELSTLLFQHAHLAPATVEEHAGTAPSPLEPRIAQLEAALLDLLEILRAKGVIAKPVDPADVGGSTQPPEARP